MLKKAKHLRTWCYGFQFLIDLFSILSSKLIAIKSLNILVAFVKISVYIFLDFFSPW